MRSSGTSIWTRRPMFFVYADARIARSSIPRGLSVVNLPLTARRYLRHAATYGTPLPTARRYLRQEQHLAEVPAFVKHAVGIGGLVKREHRGNLGLHETLLPCCDDLRTNGPQAIELRP